MWRCEASRNGESLSAICALTLELQHGCELQADNRNRQLRAVGFDALAPQLNPCCGLEHRSRFAIERHHRVSRQCEGRPQCPPYTPPQCCEGNSPEAADECLWVRVPGIDSGFAHFTGLPWAGHI